MVWGILSEGKLVGVNEYHVDLLAPLHLTD